MTGPRMSSSYLSPTWERRRPFFEALVQGRSDLPHQVELQSILQESPGSFTWKDLLSFAWCVQGQGKLDTIEDPPRDAQKVRSKKCPILFP